jgi:hypothetical protein
MLSPLNHVISRWLFTVLLTCLMTTSLTACAKEDRVVFHSFQYDLTTDSPGVDLLAFEYGDAKNEVGVRSEVKPGEITLGTRSSTAGKMPLADFLYVKWSDQSTQKVYEDRVDLKSRLPSPKDMHATKVYFLIDENKLYVYLIPQQNAEGTLNRRPANKQPNGPGGYDYLDVKTLYPDNDPPMVRGGVK